MARRSSGEGSIYQRSDRLWVGAISTGGKRRVVYGKTRKEVAAKLGTLQQDVAAGKLAEASRLTLAEFLDEWLATQRTTVRPSTHASYRDLTRVHISPTLGTLRLQHLRPLHFARLYAERQRLGFSARRVQMVHRLLHKALGDAVRWRLLNTNPVADVTAPRPQRSEQQVWTEAETVQFLERAQRYERTWDPLWPFLIGSGCRVGEALGLRWSDIDWDANTVRVARSLTFVNNRSTEGEPKTSSGRRTIILPPFALQALLVQRERQSPCRPDDGRCFTTAQGTAPTPTNLLRAFHAACRTAGVPPLRIHDLRHVHATVALRGGADLKSLQRRLGHASLAMTLGLYAHALPTGDHQAALALERALARGAS